MYRRVVPLRSKDSASITSAITVSPSRTWESKGCAVAVEQSSVVGRQPDGGVTRIDGAEKLTEVPSPEADPTPGRRWNPWKIAPIQGVDTAGIGLLRVRVRRFRRPGVPGAGCCLTPLRCVS